jgi:uncharacterized protein (TIGR04168 family)
MGAPPALLAVGDVHGCFDDVDERFVETAGAAATLFVGDFGDEDVPLVARIAALRCPKAVVLGNHDAWWSMGRRFDDRQGLSDVVRDEIRLLGAAHVSLRAAAFAADGARRAEPAGGSSPAGLVVVGGRSFSWGGPWDRHAPFYDRLHGVRDDGASADRMLGAAEEFPNARVVLLGHNGPSGLGDGRGAIYGRDFAEPFVDFGDPDQALALERMRNAGRTVIASVAGHMHHRLVGGGLRRRVVVSDGTVHVNVAVVPRHERGPDGGMLRHFARIELAARGLGGRSAVSAPPTQVAAIDDLWVDDRGEIARVVPLYAAGSTAEG